MKIDPKLITYFHEYAKKIDADKIFNVEKYKTLRDKSKFSDNFPDKLNNTIN